MTATAHPTAPSREATTPSPGLWAFHVPLISLSATHMQKEALHFLGSKFPPNHAHNSQMIDKDLAQHLIGEIERSFGIVPMSSSILKQEESLLVKCSVRNPKCVSPVELNQRGFDSTWKTSHFKRTLRQPFPCYL